MVDSKYATFGARIIAGVLDAILFLPLALVDWFLQDSKTGVVTFLTWSTITYTSVWAYSVLLHAYSGQTIGKRIVGVKVLDVSESRKPTLPQAMLRDLPLIALNSAALIYLFGLVLAGDYSQSAFDQSTPMQIAGWIAGIWLVAEVVTMLASKQRRALHDHIARTVVVHTM